VLTSKALAEFREYLASGKWDEDFGYRTPDGQEEMLDLLQDLFDLCDLADEMLTRRLYRQMSGEISDAAGDALRQE